MNNYDRYKNYTENQYNKRTISVYLMKEQADKILLPYINRIRGRRILEVGPGYGYYTRILIELKNEVTGYDINPELGKNIGIEIIRGKASEIADNIKEKYDVVISLFMSEYLSPDELQSFIEQSCSILDTNGIFATTIFLNRGMGLLYITLARIKRVKKFCYSERRVLDMIPKGYESNTIPLRSVFGIPLAFLLEVNKNE